jgi:uncharacterized protein YecT (DUF1311 family)
MVNEMRSTLARLSSLEAKGNAAVAADYAAAQAIWERYLAAECRAEGDVYLGGSLSLDVVAECHERLTALRLEDLKTQLSEAEAPH